MPVINIAKNLKVGATQVLRVMHRLEQVWPPLLGGFFCDLFDRADGPLGTTWKPGVIRRTGGFDECRTIDPYIVSGHVEGDEDLPIPGPYHVCDDFEGFGALPAPWALPTTAPLGLPMVLPQQNSGQIFDPTSTNDIAVAWYGVEIPGDHFAEITIDSMLGSMWVHVLTRFDPVTFTGQGYSFVCTSLGTPDGNAHRHDWVNGSRTMLLDAHYDTPTKLRLESTVDGRHRGYVDGVLSWDWENTTATGNYVGLMIEYTADAGHPEWVSPRLGQFCAGAMPTWTDDFERPDGPVGVEWVPGTNANYSIASGAVVSALVPEPFFGSTRLIHTNVTPLDQSAFIEVVVDGMAVGTGPTSHRTQIDLVLRHPQTGAQQGAGEQRFSFTPFLDATGITSPPPVPSMLCSIGWPDGAGGNVTNDYVPCDFSVPVTLRAESYPNGERRIYLNGEWINNDTTTTAPPSDGLHGGFAMLYMDAAMSSPRVLSVTGSGAPAEFLGHQLNDVMRTDAWPGDQYVEIETDNVHQGFVLGSEQFQIVEGQFLLYCQANDVDFACTAVWCEYFINSPTDAQLWAYVFQQDALGQVVPTPPGSGILAEGFLDNFAFPDDPVCKLRLEVGANGRVRMLASDDEFTNAVVIDATVPPLTGDRVGFAFMWHNTSYDSADPLTGTGTSFHILSACGGNTELPPPIP